MKNTVTIVVLLIFGISGYVRPQYQPTSPYIQNPELAIGYTDSCAQFWLQTWDDQIGGFFTNIDKFGNVINGWGTNKNMLTQSRNAYGMVRAYMLTGDTTYLSYAKWALNWMYEHAWDTLYGGWFQELNINGNPINPTSDKTAFYQHYALLGITAYYEATGDTLALNWLMQGYQHLENYYWDNRPDYHGYYDKTNYNNTNAWDKSFNATVDAITTHLLYLYLMTKDESYKIRLQELAEEMKQHLVGSMPQQAIGFVERFDSNWNWNNNETMTIMGHVLKTGWCLARINQLLPDTSYVSTARYLIDDVWQNGYDHEYGGPYKDFNRITGEMLLWGLSDSTKAWWQMEQAIVAGLQMFDITREYWFLQMADETINFFMNYFVDHQNGEVYADRTRYGGFAWNEAKGNSGKSGYHSIETGYYTYLYGNLFYAYQPAVLHYNFEPLQIEREILLTPIAISDSNLIISHVLLDGQTYTNFDPANRILDLPSGIGGHFEVTYERQNINSTEDQIAIVTDFELYQNYPNPFNPSTNIEFQIANLGFVSLKVYDILGNEVATLIDQELTAGLHEVEFNGSNFSSGIYFYQLRAAHYVQTKKMMLVK
jgi:mannose/cellobiose epimerase-like protein (N-acyl-D-glucosamine 2-epimerase family)